MSLCKANRHAGCRFAAKARRTPDSGIRHSCKYCSICASYSSAERVSGMVLKLGMNDGAKFRQQGLHVPPVGQGGISGTAGAQPRPATKDSRTVVLMRLRPAVRRW